MARDSETERIEKIAFSVVERAVPDLAEKAIAAHSLQCGASVALQKLEDRMNTLESRLVDSIEKLTESVNSLDRKLVGGTFEFKDVDRRIIALKERVAAHEKLFAQYDAQLRNLALKIVFGGSVIAALAVAAAKVIQ